MQGGCQIAALLICNVCILVREPINATWDTSRLTGVNFDQ
jgi:hypothetical protein